MRHYKKMRKIIVLLVSLIISFPCTNVCSDEERFLTSDIVLNYSGLSIGSISIDGNTIVIDDITDEYPVLLLELRRGSEMTYTRTEKNCNHKAKFITGIREGEYQLYLFYNDSEYGTFDSVLNGDLAVYFSNGEGYIINCGQVLKQNLLIKSQEILSDEMLEFFLKPSNDIESNDADIIAMSEEITKDCYTQYEKTLRIHDWIADNIFYNRDYINGNADYGDQSAKAVLASHVGVCAGYSNLMAAMSRAVGIPSRIVHGVSFDDYYIDDPMTQESNHAWCEVYVDEKWRIIDVTWDTDNRYEDGRFIQRKGCKSHLYFDISIEGLSMKHLTVRNNQYNKLFLYVGYPKLNKNGKEWIDLDSGISPVLIDNKTFIPVRAIIESMGGKVLFYKDGSFDKIRIFMCNHDVQMWIGHSTYYADGIAYKFDSPPQIVSGYTMIPLRSVLEPIGCIVTWDNYADNWYGRITIGYTS